MIREDLIRLEAELNRQPLPVADALLNFSRAEEPFERVSQAETLMRTSTRFVTGVAIAASLARPPRVRRGEAEVRRYLSDLRTKGTLSDGAWWSLGRELLRGYAKEPDTHPLPRLVALVHGRDLRGDTTQRIDRLVHFRNQRAHRSPSDRAEVEAMVEDVWPDLKKWIDTLGELWTGLSLVVPATPPYEQDLCQRASVLMGPAPSRGRWIRIDLAPGERLSPGVAALVDDTGREVLALGPAILVQRPEPHREEEVFFLEGRKSDGRTHYVSYPNVKDHYEEPVWDKLDTLCSQPHIDKRQLLKDVAPFRGLDSFGPEHAEIFFGRESEIVDVGNLIRQVPLVTLTGPSGIGKTSLLRAGVGPTLGRSDQLVMSTLQDESVRQDPSSGYREAASVLPEYLFIYARPGSAPYASLRDAIDHGTRDGSSGEPPTSREGETPEQWAERLVFWAETGRRVLVVVLDQAEELLTQGSSRDERNQACELLALLSASEEQPSRVVLSVRGDFFHRIKELERLAATYDHHVKVLGRLSRAELRHALTQPVKLCGGEFELGLDERIVDDLEGLDNALPLLQFVANALWESRDQRSCQLTHEAYELLGGATGALAAHADAVYDSFGDVERSIARRLLLGLVGREGTRLVATEDELRARAGGQDVNRVLTHLVNGRILTSREGSDAGGYELIHEALVDAWPRLCAWRDEVKAALAHLGSLREAVRAWEASQHSDDLLWRGDPLAAHRAWAAESEIGLQQRERAFVDASERASRRARRVRVWIAGTAGVVVLSFAAFAGLQWREAERQADVATRGERAAVQAREQALATAFSFASSVRLGAGDRIVGALWAVESATRNGMDPNRLEAIRILRTALDHVGGRPLNGHQAGVTAVTFSADGARVATASWDGTARVWLADGLGEPVVLRGHDGPVWDAAFSPDGERVVTASPDLTARVWAADGEGEPVLLRGHEDAVVAASFSPDGDRVLTASFDGTARVWAADGSGEAVVLRGHENVVIGNVNGHPAICSGAVETAAFSPDGEQVVTAACDGTVRVWAADGSAEAVVFRHAGVRAASFSPDGERILSYSGDGTVHVWPADGSGDPMILHRDGVTAWGAAFTMGGERVVAPFDGGLLLWAVDGTGASTVLPAQLISQRLLAFGEETVVTATSDGTVRVWDTTASHQQIALVGHDQGPVFAAGRFEGEVGLTAALSPDGGRVITASSDGTARVWDTTGSPDGLLLGSHARMVLTVGFSSDGESVVTASSDGTARVWSADGSREPIVLAGHEGGPRMDVGLDGERHYAGESNLTAAFSPDGERVVTASSDGTARVWATDGSGEPIVLAGHEGEAFAAAFSPDGERIVVAFGDGTARVWPADGSGEPIVLGHGAAVHTALFSPDGERILTVDSRRLVRVWPADGSSDPVVFPEDDVFGRMIAVFSPDGNRVALTSHDGVRIWSVTGRDEPVVLRTGGESIAFSPDGNRVAIGSTDATVRVLDADGSGEPVVLRGHVAGVTDVMFSPDGTLILSVSRDRTVRVWTADGAGEPVVLHGRVGGVTAAAFSPDGTQIVAGSTRGTVWVWSLEATVLVDELCRRVGRNLTRAEWTQYASGVAYDLPCPQWGEPQPRVAVEFRYPVRDLCTLGTIPRALHVGQ
ncbi:MAG: WD40 repeat domain-containing protein [Polyangiaceae bacterium]|nr:WD40 repeat domain-containing protein [Polyangiaceae bacterium]MCB9629758.1 WD40 repeat domain-containing protein [Sandaracinaceae bacterium]